MIISWDDRYKEQAIALWNVEAVKDGFKELTENSFNETFAVGTYFKQETSFLYMDEGKVVGFAIGCIGDDLPLGAEAGYISCLVVAEAFQSTDCGDKLIAALEGSFVQAGKKQADVLFFNPMRLIWLIEGTPAHEHNNAPGVPQDSWFYRFLLAKGYVERSTQCGMYLDISSFSIPDDIVAKEEKAKGKGYTVELYDAERHSGLREMAMSFDNPMWEKEIPHYAEQNVPIVTAIHDGKAVGFAGPVIRQDNGRAFFCGIGVNANHEGHGLGSILFFKMCETLQSIGTDYISLFTGSTNPAIRIYEKAGFKTVRQFGVMRKEFS